LQCVLPCPHHREFWRHQAAIHTATFGWKGIVWIRSNASYRWPEQPRRSTIQA
jgi:hypothetical protein